MNTDSTLSTTGDFSPDTSEAIVREATISFAIGLFSGLASLLPGTGIEITGTDISVGEVVVAAGSLGIVGSLVWVGCRPSSGICLTARRASRAIWVRLLETWPHSPQSSSLTGASHRYCSP